MSPVSRRRPGTARPGGRRRAPADALRAAEVKRLRAEQPLQALTSRLARLERPVDGFMAEAVTSYVLEVVVGRGPDADESLARFSRAAVADPQSSTTPLGLQAMAVLAQHGHREVRAEARALLEDADADLREQLPAWVAHVGEVEVVRAGVLRTAAGDETVLHLLLDHVDPAAGPRHLLTLAVAHADHRVHLLDVRVRSASDDLVAMAERYTGSSDRVWSWAGVDDIRAAADPALRTTSEHTPSQWPVLGVEGGQTLTWALGVHRLEQVTGAVLV